MPSQLDEPNVYEVFAQFGGAGKQVQHVGSVRCADAALAWHAAKEVYTRREDCTVLWVAPRPAFLRSGPDDAITLANGSSRRYRAPKYPSGHRRARGRDAAVDHQDSEST